METPKQLRATLFGGFHLNSIFEGSEQKTTRTVRALLAFLLVYRNRAHPREILASIFWADQSEQSARNCLNTTLWRLRRVLEPEGVHRGTYLRITPGGDIAFNVECDHWVDVEEFEQQMDLLQTISTREMTPGEFERVEKALALYQGDLLEGFFEDWALRERERVRLRYLSGLARMAAHYAQMGQYESSLLFSMRILQMDPLREEVHRDMMRLYLANGQHALAMRQYQLCQDALHRELGIEPMPETQRLYAAILAQRADKLGETTNQSHLYSAVQQIRVAMQHIELALEQIEQGKKASS